MRFPVVEYVDASAVFRGYLPRRELRRYIELIWMVSGTPSIASEHVLPNGALEIIINLGPPHYVRDRRGDTVFRKAWLAGLQQAPLQIGMVDNVSELVGIRFRPGGAQPVLAMPLTEVTDRVIELDTDAELLDARSQMFEASADGRLAIIEAFLMRRIAARVVDERIMRALEALTSMSIDDVSQRAGVSRKHLADLFRHHVGVTPKMLSRILRFHAVIEGIEKSEWADLAYANGYADQAHMCREFRTFAGVTPTEYLRLRTVDPNHVSASAKPRAESPSA